MSKSQEKLFSMLANSTSKGYLIKGYTKRINQFIPNNFINVSANTSVVPTSNKCGSYITIITPTNLVGHKVFAKITTDSIFIKCCWYKTATTAYDFATGDLLDNTSQPIVPLSGIYEITNDMVYSDGYLQLYWWVYQGCPTGMHSLTIQLVDLTEIYGAGNEPTSVNDFIADYPLFSNGTYNFTGVAGDLISAKAPFVATKDSKSFVYIPSSNFELVGEEDGKSTLATSNGKHTKKSNIGNLIITTKDGQSFKGTYFLASPVLAVGIPDYRFVCSRYKTYADNATYNEGISPIPTAISAPTEVRVYDNKFRDYTLAQMQTEQQGVKICFPLKTTTTEKVNSIRLPSGITKIVDTYGQELEFEEL